MHTADLAQTKNVLRARAKQRRAALPPEARAAWSAAIQTCIVNHAAFRAARCVLAYSSFGDEVATDVLLATVRAQNKILLLPRVDPAGLVVHVVDDPAQDLRPGPWGIREPDPARCAVADVGSADLIAVPGLAFTTDGMRIGYGRGYYDRLLPGARQGLDAPMVAALAFEAQIFDALPRAAHDLPMGWIVTEKRLIDCRRFQPV